MRRLDERFDFWISHFSNEDTEVIDFIFFVCDDMSTSLCKEAIKIDNQEEFLQYLLCAFGCYRISHNYGIPHLIRNPEALSLTPDQQKELLNLLRTTIVAELETSKTVKVIKGPKKQ